MYWRGGRAGRPPPSRAASGWGPERGGGVEGGEEDGGGGLEGVAHGHALGLGQGALDQRHAEVAQPVRHAVELVEPRRGEALRDRLLLEVEDVDREAAALEERGVALRFVGHADQDQRRVERDRAERAGR